jgi:uncharacterized membrane protein
METVISRLLSLGVILSCLVVTTGGALLLVSSGAATIDIGHFHGQAGSLKTIAVIFESARAISPTAIIQIGLLILVATPVARVGLSMLLFLKKGDYLYVGITGLVLTIVVLAISGQP